MTRTTRVFFAMALAFVAMCAMLAPLVATQPLPTLPNSFSYRARIIDSDGNLVYTSKVYQSLPFNGTVNASRVYTTDAGSKRLQENLKFWNQTHQNGRTCTTNLQLLSQPITCETGGKVGPTRVTYLVPESIPEGCTLSYLGTSTADAPYARCDLATLSFSGYFFHDTVSSDQLHSWKISCQQTDGYSSDYTLDTTYRFWKTDQENYVIESTELLSERYDYNTHVLLERSTQTTIYDCYFPCKPISAAFDIV